MDHSCFFVDTLPGEGDKPQKRPKRHCPPQLLQLHLRQTSTVFELHDPLADLLWGQEKWVVKRNVSRMGE
jgi:hypothetical protein